MKTFIPQKMKRWRHSTNIRKSLITGEKSLVEVIIENCPICKSSAEIYLVTAC